MPDVPRYAVYFCPAARSPLARFGASVLGYDVAFCETVDIAPALGRWFPDWRRRVAEPARYGFHATLKAPFELLDGASEAGVLGSAETIASTLECVGLGHLRIAAMGRFLALVPLDFAAARPMAQTVVECLDHLRAPLGAADRERRLRTPLTPRQNELLDRWGYPYVADQFRFHMTLTGPLSPPDMQHARSLIEELYRPLDAPVALDAIALLKQPTRNEPFRLLQRFPLRSGAFGPAR